MMPSHLRSSRGFTLWELSAVLVILAVLIVIFLPVYSNHLPGKPKQTACLSNVKQIGLALMMYVQDYDDTFPPAVGQLPLSNGIKHEQEWGLTTKARVKGKEEPVVGIIDSYIKSQNIFRCPAVMMPNVGLTYLFSDLAAARPMKDFDMPPRTVVITDSEDRLRNTGHAKSQSRWGDAAVLRPVANGKAPRLLLGVAVGDAVSRHSGGHIRGGIYGFADGHAKWLKSSAVFFPPRSSNSVSHRDARTGKTLGPDLRRLGPGSTTYQGKSYSATFHTR